MVKNVFIYLISLAGFLYSGDYSESDLDSIYKDYVLEEKKDKVKTWTSNRFNGMFIDISLLQGIKATSVMQNSTGSLETPIQEVGFGGLVGKVGYQHGSMAFFGSLEWQRAGEIDNYNFAAGIGWDILTLSLDTKYRNISLYPSIYIQQGISINPSLSRTYMGWQNVAGIDYVLSFGQSFEIKLGYRYEFVFWESDYEGVLLKTNEHFYGVTLGFLL